MDVSVVFQLILPKKFEVELSEAAKKLVHDIFYNCLYIICHFFYKKNSIETKNGSKKKFERQIF